ncbi:hypothetical protein AB3Y40_17575 [Yoonia sp. R2331]|uniref:hypothetical protein n=1 Tax=Yoonia sp. R2331 TaxID=3237238 RepID=UPI0034E5386F
MTDASLQGPWAKPKAETEALHLPAPVAFDAPVLIGDCTTPLAGETLLSLLWKRLDDTNEEGRDERGPSDRSLVTRQNKPTR